MRGLLRRDILSNPLLVHAASMNRNFVIVRAILLGRHDAIEPNSLQPSGL
jgi:hypothetical protein